MCGLLCVQCYCCTNRFVVFYSDWPSFTIVFYLISPSVFCVNALFDVLVLNILRNFVLKTIRTTGRVPHKGVGLVAAVVVCSLQHLRLVGWAWGLELEEELVEVVSSVKLGKD